MLKRGPQRLGFFWRGLLITLPVMVLAAAGFVSLRQDRLLVEHDAAERAQDLADGLLPSLWRTLLISGKTELPTLTIDATGEVVFPPAVQITPAPRPLEGDELPAAQRAQWRAVRDAPVDGPERWLEFIASKPPSNYQAAAYYAIALRFLEAGQRQSAADHFLAVSREFPEAVGETGLPLQPLAEFKLLTLASPGSRTDISVAAFCSNIVHRPTPLTPYLLGAAARLAEAPGERSHCEHWLKVWGSHEIARRMAAALQENPKSALSIPPFLWIPPTPLGESSDSSPDRWFLVQTQEEKGIRSYICHRESELARQVPESVSATFRIPAYFAVKVAVGGREFAGPSTALTAKVLATAVGKNGITESLRVTVSLTDPNALFKRQRLRSFWFGLLIAAAAATAIVGFVGTWHAYAKQRRLNDLKSDFVSSVSHELRAPIASVRLMAESLDRGKIVDETKRRDYFRFISQECRRLSALIENVLDFARIDQGRKQYEFEAADLVALLRNTFTLMEPCATEREIKLLLQVPQPAPGSLAVVMDAKAIQQALVNLVDNAIKHSAAGSAVTLGLEPGDPVRIWVEDRGPGIPSEEHTKIFERFYRRGSELRRETQGVGIGLSIVKHVVEAHHGRVLVRSAVGEGSRFTIELPVRLPTTDH